MQLAKLGLTVNDLCFSSDPIMCLGFYSGQFEGIDPTGAMQSKAHPEGFTFDITALERAKAALRNNPLFIEGNLGKMHCSDTGCPNSDFRSRNVYGLRSLQVDFGPRGGYTDFDRFNPYQNPLGHFFGEVVPGTIGGWFGSIFR